MIPSSTYRIQFSSATTLQQGAELVPYLDALGVGAVYASPLLDVGRGQQPRLRRRRPHPDLRRSAAARRAGAPSSRPLRERGMGFLLDIVPNHVGVDVAQGEPVVVGRAHARPGVAVRVVLRHRLGRAGPLLLPILGAEADPADEEKVLAEQVTLSDDRTELRYYEHAFPVAPGTGEAGSAQEVHERQHYRLTSWKRGAAELTYRRFFDVSTLAAVRVEDPEVFAATHGEVLRWVEAGEVDGLRVDHPDGLSDPGGYARRLRAAIGPDRWLLVEKILGVGEELPVSWPVDGTSGYEALREICGVFVDADGAGLLTQLTAEHLGRRENAHAVEHAARREVADTILAAEVRRIAALVPVAPTDDGPGAAAEEAVAELLCGFPVYRSYLPEGRSALETAVSVARAHRPDLAEVLATIRDTMLADPDGELATRVQQTSGMVMAKGVEDTAFYRYNRLVALNEVGGDPDRFGVSPAEFHDRNAGRVASWPRTMTTLSTHDTKRSEDVRARLAVLAEIPDEWAPRFRRWAAAHPLPDRSLDLLAWQNLVGAWPISAERLAAYLGKASREAKLVTSHIDPNAEVDAAVAAWPEQVLGDAGTVAEVAEFVARIDEPGRSNSLGQKLLQIAGPGVPDVYQGTELYEYSLVDPDNRRPVDWELRRRLLARIDGGWLPEFSREGSNSVDVDPEGATKLLVTAQALLLRRQRPELFAGYRSVPADGPAAEHAIAFARSAQLVAVATRLPVRLAAGGGWADTVLPLPDGAAAWTDVLTGTPVESSAPRLAQVLARYPVALLVRAG